MSHLGGHKIMFTVLVIYTTGSVFSNIVRNGVDDIFFFAKFQFWEQNIPFEPLNTYKHE